MRKQNENDRIKYFRKEVLHFSQEEFGARLGVTKVAISLIENGTRNVTDQMRMSICREYGVREEWLLNGTGPMTAPDPETELDALCNHYGLNDRSRAFIKEFAELPDKERQAVLAYIEKVAAAIREESAKPDPDIQQLHEDLDKEIALQKKPGEKSTGSDSMPA